jgi:hypothetical protein
VAWATYVPHMFFSFHLGNKRCDPSELPINDHNIYINIAIKVTWSNYTWVAISSMWYAKYIYIYIYMSRTKASKCFFSLFFFPWDLHTSWLSFVHGVCCGHLLDLFMCLFLGPALISTLMSWFPTWATKEQGYMPCMNIVARPMEYDTQGMPRESREVDGRWQAIRPSDLVFCSLQLNLNIYERRTILFVCRRFDILDYRDVFYHMHMGLFFFLFFLAFGSQ